MVSENINTETASVSTQIFICRVEYSQLAAEYKPLNLGQGFPDFASPDYVTKALVQVATGDNTLLHQYTRGFVKTY